MCCRANQLYFLFSLTEWSIVLFKFDSIDLVMTHQLPLNALSLYSFCSFSPMIFVKYQVKLTFYLLYNNYIRISKQFLQFYLQNVLPLMSFSLSNLPSSSHLLHLHQGHIFFNSVPQTKSSLFRGINT